MVHIEGLSKVYKTENGSIRALNEVSLDIPDGAFVALLGKSGCGKTTLLRLIAGLEKATSGKLSCSVPSESIGCVFQEPRLMPWLTVAENIRFAEKGKIKNAFGDVNEILRTLGLELFANAFPHELSGGMAQRVALGRTLFCKPSLILMDEPFGALDWFTRKALQDDLLRMWQKGGKTVLFVTHDIDEALILAEQVLVMHEGNIIDRFKVDKAYPAKTADLTHLRERVLESLELK